MSETDPAKRLRALLDTARRAVIFTGAGISTESGIPDFRSPGGIWTRVKPIDFSDFVRSAEIRKEYWRRNIELGATLSDAKPNRGHRAVAALVRRGQCRAVVTQNIDGLHQASGVPDDNVIELHGNASYVTCLTCAKRYELAHTRARFQQTGEPPTCDGCGGIVKTATISFGQAMPERAMHRADEAVAGCDLFIAIGSSLVVYPAAGYPVVAKRSGAKLVILNREPTELDFLADLVLNAEIGPTLGDAVGVE